MKRLIHVDIARSITIILMIVGHGSIPTYISNWIYSFHMPFFFIISGMMTNWKKNNKQFIINKVASLITPFFIYSLINIAIYSFIQKEYIPIYASRIIKHGWGGVALWFIPVLFISLICCKLIFHIKSQILFAIILSLVSCIFSYFEVNLPWTLATVPIACIYILLGHLVAKGITNMIYNANLIIQIFILIIGLCITIPISHFYRLDLASNQILPFIPLLLCSFAGFITIMTFSIIISKYKIISQIIEPIGKHTYEIMALSQCIISFLNLYIQEYKILKYLIMTSIIFFIIVIKSKFKTVNKNAHFHNPHCPT